MLAVRAPVLGVALAVGVLVLECAFLVGLDRRRTQDVVATQEAEQMAAEAATRAARVALETMRKLEAEAREISALIDELKRLDAEIERFRRPGCNSFRHPELRELQLLREQRKQRLNERMQRMQRQLDDRRMRRNDMLLVPTTAPTRVEHG